MKRTILLPLFFIAFTAQVLIGQSCPTYTSFGAALQGSSQLSPGGTINFTVTSKPGPITLREKNKSARLLLKLDLGDNYIKQNSPGWKFTALVYLSYKFAGNPSVVKTLTITETKPEELRTEDVASVFTSSSPSLNITVNQVTITDGAGNVLTGTGLLQNYIFSNIRLVATLEREYNVDVRFASNTLISNPPIVSPVSISNRLITFSWQPNAGGNYPNYELQVLKLENTSNTSNPAVEVLTGIDWNKALKVETQSCKTSIALTVGEGSGYYIWRVRPIGNFFTGGVANSENYGEWSSSLSPSVSTINLSNSVLTPTSVSMPFAFYFTDPDENINWIYNRVFTEGDVYDKSSPTGIKTSEGITYAGSLLNTRQSQKFNSSENTNVVSQTIDDYSGRPALNTLPVPVSGGLTGYKASLVKDPSGNLYTAQNFDSDTKLNDPDQVMDNNTAFSYYSGNSVANGTISNANLSSSEGYPFKRTLFKTDGTGRAEEESGVGKAHSIGSRSAGRGHTTRVYYSTPSEDELIRLFGDEAPLAQSVIKTTTIDQNDVISVTYTSKEGKTIATALSSASVAALSALNGTISAFTVSNTINENVYTNGRMVASKRISLSAPLTTLNLQHTTSSLPDDSPGCITASCNYKLRLYILDVKNKITYVSDCNTATPGEAESFTTASSATLIFSNYPSWAFVSQTSITQSIIPFGGGLNQISLPEGEYVFVKELYSTNGADYADAKTDEENERTRVVFEAIADKMKNVKNALEKALFNQWMSDFKSKFNAYVNAPSTLLSNNLITHLCIDKIVPSSFVFPSPPYFSLSALTTNTADPATENLEITTSCCGSLAVSLPKGTICVLCDGVTDDATQSSSLTISQMTQLNSQAGPDEITPFGFNDFKTNTTWNTLNAQAKRDAIKPLVERELINELKNKLTEEGFDPNTELWKVAPGFNYESLNFMLSNMLISQYYTGSVIKFNNNWYEATKNASGGYNLGNLITTASTYPYNYDCKDIWNNWLMAMGPINSYELESGKENVIKEYENAQGPYSVLNDVLDIDNWNPSLRSALQLASSKLASIINKFKTTKAGSVSKERIESLASVVSLFMTSVGPQYAAIIDGSSLPGYISTSGGAYPDEYLASASILTLPPQGPTGNAIYTTCITGVNAQALSHSYVPVLFTLNGLAVQVSTTTCNNSVYNELYYPYILKPEWMFKYFVYNVYENRRPVITGAVSFINDDDYLLPHQVLSDINYNYNPPITYLPPGSTVSASNLCYQPPYAGYTVAGTAYTYTYTHSNWTSKERLDFYNEVISGAPCFEAKGITVGSSIYSPSSSLPVCPSKADLFAEANKQLSDYLTVLDARTGAIQSALLDELASSCYTIVPCRSSPSVPGEITIAEVNLMVDAVIARCKDQIQKVKDNFNITPTSNVAACGSTSSAANSQTLAYSATQSCQLPLCIQTDCNEIVLFEDNSLGTTDSRRMEVRLFKDCDQNLLDMITLGSFLPYIAPISPNCDKAAKEWKSCTGSTSCDNGSNSGANAYGEKTGCTPTQFEKYSKEYTITATGN